MNLLTQLSQLSRLAIYGYGQEGQSLHRWLQHRYPHLQIDILNDTAINVSACKVYSGDGLASRLLSYRLVFKSPGISPYQPSIQAAMQQGVRFSSATQLWFASTQMAYCLVISGTKGKSTTSSLVAHILRVSGKEVVLAGNIGYPLLDQSASINAIWVLELSSYQLWDFEASPDMVVLLNLFPEHLDWHGSTEQYYQDKLHILTRPASQTIRIVNAEDPLITRHYQGAVQHYFNHPEFLYVKEGQLYQGQQRLACEGFQLRGEHNLKNLAAALTIVEQLAIPVSKACQSIHDFEALPHRLAYLGQRAGLTYVDDSISTTPQSALAALKSYADTKITLILGGYDRGLDWVLLAQALPLSSVTIVITLPDNADKITAAIKAVTDSPPIYHAANMAAAIHLAQQYSQPDSLVLLSPGAPSYGHYQNFKQRGQHFAQLAGF